MKGTEVFYTGEILDLGRKSQPPTYHQKRRNQSQIMSAPRAAVQPGL
ncbi:MAG: hypothetical protein Q8O94_01660 [bacterium]|nr:hypothetical protein [bacterium]